MNREQTLKPFAPGDIFVGLTELNDPTDDHAGDGRIVQFGADLEKKGELWTEGGHHLIGGLAFGPDGLLWAFNDHSIIHVDPRTARQLPLSPKFKPRTYRSVSFAPGGDIWLGEHLLAKDPPPGIEKRTTIKFTRLPDTGWLGHGRFYRYDRDWNLAEEFDVEHSPEPTGFKGISHATMHPNGRFITYITETGKRIMRFDIVGKRQMPDLLRYPGDNIRDGNWVTAVRYLPDGRFLAIRAVTMDMVGEDGATLREYPLDGTRGWAAITPCRDGRHVLLANNWTGMAGRYDLERGKFTATIDTGYSAPRRSLSGIAEFTG